MKRRPKSSPRPTSPPDAALAGGDDSATCPKAPPFAPKGRGAHENPPNRFQRLHVEADFEQLEHDEDLAAQLERPKTEYLVDASRSIVTENDSPDVGFRYSINPYRGCAHGCAYCYARPTHEYLGFSAGLDFETKVLVKPEAPALLREFLARPGWRPEPIALSGVTDPYQPAERQFRLTRQCLEVAWECRQPVSLITKNALVLRDLDLLGAMAACRLTHVLVSITTLEQSLTRVMEPRTSAPAARLEAVRRLTEAGVPVMVMVAPVIPGLTDHEIPALLAAAAEAGAVSAAMTLVRLPPSVQPVFLEWLQRTQALARERVENAIRSTRDGELTHAEFGKRLRGTGLRAEQIRQMFRTFAQRHGLRRPLPDLDVESFHPPPRADGQMRLF